MSHDGGSDDRGSDEGLASPPQPQARPVRSGIDVAREALAAARAQARQQPRPPSLKARRSAREPTGRRSGAGPDDRDPQPLGAALRRLLGERGWQVPVAGAGAIARWSEIVGAEVAAHCQAESYDDGTLTVVADSTAWATQVRLLTPQLVRRLNETLGPDTVRRVVVRGPAAPSWRKGRLHVRGRGPRDTYG